MSDNLNFIKDKKTLFVILAILAVFIAVLTSVIYFGFSGLPQLASDQPQVSNIPVQLNPAQFTTPKDETGKDMAPAGLTKEQKSKIASDIIEKFNTFKSGNISAVKKYLSESTFSSEQAAQFKEMPNDQIKLIAESYANTFGDFVLEDFTGENAKWFFNREGEYYINIVKNGQSFMIPVRNINGAWR